MSRVRNRRTGQWIELPEDDGLCTRFKRVRNEAGKVIRHEPVFITPDLHKQIAQRYMGDFDGLSLQNRWGENQFGKTWRVIRAGRRQPWPLAKTDPKEPSQLLRASDLGL